MSFGLDDAAMMQAAAMGMQMLGTMAQRSAANDEREQKLAVLNRGADEQAAIAQQNAARAAATAKQLDATQQQEAQKKNAEKLATDYAPTQAGFNEAGYQASTSEAPKEIADSMAAAVGRALAQGKAYAKNKANLSALNYGDTASNIAIGRSASDIGLNNNRAQGAQQVMNADLNAIYPDQNKMVGADILNGIGSGLYMYGAKKAGQTPPILPGGVGAQPY